MLIFEAAVSTESISINRSVIDGVLTYAKICHPKEAILLLRGTEEKNEIHVDEIVIPPFATHGYGFSSFPIHALPFDLSIVGTAHSHPNGGISPSIQDLNHIFSILLVIIAFPYESERQIAVYDKNGNVTQYTILEAK